jgi:glutathione S-transferase
LISHVLCPYVQRAVIALTEKRVPFERIDVDLANKSQWFSAISPLGKAPVLKVDGTAIFESAVILEYLEETQPLPLHPSDPLRRAEHRSWIEFGSAVLNDIAGFYGAADETPFMQKAAALADKFKRLEARLEVRLGAGPYFDGERFSLVDAVFGPVFRYFDVFDRIGEFGILAGKPKVVAYRQALAARPSVRAAVASDYNSRLWTFLQARNSQLSQPRRAKIELAPAQLAMRAHTAPLTSQQTCNEGLLHPGCRFELDRFAAATGRGLVRIIEHELRRQLVDPVIHLGAQQEQHCLGIDQDAHALVLDDFVQRIDLLGIIHDVGHAGAAAVLNADAHGGDRMIGFRHHRLDAFRRGFGEPHHLRSGPSNGHLHILRAFDPALVN